MRQVSLSDTEEFFQSVRTGELLPFVDVLDIDVNDVMKAGEHISAKRVVKGWIASSKLPYCMVNFDQMQLIYNVLIATHSTRLSPMQFKKMAMKMELSQYVNGLTELTALSTRSEVQKSNGDSTT